MMSRVLRKNSLAPPCRPAVVQCKAYKGFGSPKKRSKGSEGKSGLAKSPQQAADRALAEATRPSVRPVDPKEAARGKVDYVQVKDWANGAAADIGDLQVVAGSMGTGYAAGGSGQGAPAPDESTPFYQQLAQHAQYLERQGALSIANTASAKPYLPFESWQYSLPRYQQYLAEVAAVHLALEAAMQLALAPPAPPPAAASATAASPQQQHNIQNSHGSRSSSSSAPWAVPGRDEVVLQAYGALECFGPSSGLWRAAAAQADLQAICSQLSAAAPAAGVGGATAPQAGQHSTLAQHGPSKHKQAGGVHASQNAVAYGKYLLQLGNAAAAATEAATARGVSSSSSSSSDGLVAEEVEGAAAVLKLLAHAYALQVHQQCLGARIGAAATEKLQLLSAGAVRLYVDYPDWLTGEPVQQLMSITDAAGRKLGVSARQAVLDELPKALQKSALMLAPLATTA